jgi:hypothetical protein
VRTLAMFLRSDRRLKPASAALHVHVNTLRYRLARIEQLLGVDLEDVEARFQLEFAMKLLEARGRIPTDQAGVAHIGAPRAYHRRAAGQAAPLPSEGRGGQGPGVDSTAVNRAPDHRTSAAS